MSCCAEEIESLARHLVQRQGVRTIRLVGGEPTARADLGDIVGRLARIDGLEDLAMTSSGIDLARHAKALKAAGLRRVNINLDTLTPEKYQRMQGIDGLSHVLEGIDAAISAGLAPVKLNVTVVRGENDFELPELLLFAQWRKLEIRFVELLPSGPAQKRWEQLYVSESEMRQRLSDVVNSWVARRDNREASRCYCAGLTWGRSVAAGFITAISCPFCDSCNRIRVAADGSLYPCLRQRACGNILTAIRPVFEPAALDAALGAALAKKADPAGKSLTDA